MTENVSLADSDKRIMITKDELLEIIIKAVNAVTKEEFEKISAFASNRLSIDDVGKTFICVDGTKTVMLESELSKKGYFRFDDYYWRDAHGCVEDNPTKDLIDTVGDQL